MDTGTDTSSQETPKAEPEEEALEEPTPDWPSEPKALILALEDRKKLLEMREREVARREDKVASLELEAVAKIQELTALREEVRATLAELEKKYEVQSDKYALQVAQKKAEIAQQEAAQAEQEREEALLSAEKRKTRLAQLVATLKGMRPQAGGEMLASMDESEAVEVLGMLAPRLAASLLGAMPADKSARLAGLLIGIGQPKTQAAPPTSSEEEKPAGQAPAEETPKPNRSKTGG
jgi:flagellar motility protein MotE (MotC chaperone)